MICDISGNSTLRQAKPNAFKKHRPLITKTKTVSTEEVKVSAEENKKKNDEKRLRQERKSYIVETEVAKYYQDLLPNKVRAYII